WDFCGIFIKRFMGCAKKPPLSGEAARRNAETERLQQICDDLSVASGAQLPLIGKPFIRKNRALLLQRPVWDM
ncbi:MAG: hypothetical protein V8S99_10935, partial [Oscillospiraceae bacterium]